MPGTSEHSNRELAERAAALLLQDIANPPSLETLAREVGLTSFQLSRIFGTFLGYTIPGLFRHHRMDRAAEALRETRRGIGEIAVSVGYHSVSAFCRAFERELKMTPSEYRQQWRSNAVS
jgi:AraC family transcriptional regulator